MSDARPPANGDWYWAYREQVARIPRTFGYIAADPLTGKPVPFDGFRPGASGKPGTFLHAVDPCWAEGIAQEKTAGAATAVSAGFMLDLAERQARAAGGRAVEWHAADPATAEAVGRLLAANRLPEDVAVVYDPARASGSPPADVAVRAGQAAAEPTAGPSVTVYWGDRPEGADQCARRFLRMMDAIDAAGVADPWAWHASVPGRSHPVPLIMEPLAVVQLLLAGGQFTNETSERVPELGFRLYAASAAGEPAALTVRCGISAGPLGLVNGVVLTLAPGEDERPGWADRSDLLLRSLDQAWEPGADQRTGVTASGPGTDDTGMPSGNGPA